MSSLKLAPSTGTRSEVRSAGTLLAIFGVVALWLPITSTAGLALLSLGAILLLGAAGAQE